MLTLGPHGILLLLTISLWTLEGTGERRCSELYQSNEVCWVSDKSLCKVATLRPSSLADLLMLRLARYCASLISTALGPRAAAVPNESRHLLLCCEFQDLPQIPSHSWQREL
ncbi:hypothetical protein DR999_PMT01349 [Platysternon megacephalum]|uniref:Uncharacterized protein n=1 Tax=Platysternon megacephalum TaxID=55544 RepID=A0A4D9F0E3_9SAUR|nr:hypothetical protein DR999_PMT01349 [Platysternon megacephalum]